MARPFKITDEQLITLIEEYRREYPKKKIRYRDIEAYALAKGYEGVKVDNFKKRKVITDLIKKLNEDTAENHIVRILTYSPLDINKIFAEHTSMARIKQILNDREQYLAQIVASATFINEEYKKLESYNASLKANLKEAKEELAKLTLRAETLAQKDREIEFLKQIINENLYPEVANTLLNKDYISEAAKGSSISKSTILPVTKKSIFEHSEIDELLGDLDDDI